MGAYDWGHTAVVDVVPETPRKYQHKCPNNHPLIPRIVSVSLELQLLFFPSGDVRVYLVALRARSIPWWMQPSIIISVWGPRWIALSSKRLASGKGRSLRNRAEMYRACDGAMPTVTLTCSTLDMLHSTAECNVKISRLSSSWKRERERKGARN